MAFLPLDLVRPQAGAPRAGPTHEYAAAALLSLFGAAAFLPAAFPAATAAAAVAVAVAYCAACAGIAALLRRHYPHAALGLCNAVTQARLALVALLIVPLASGHPGGWAVAALALGALSLDGVDGWLARRSGLASRFGARFDMEVDAAMALVLSLHAATAGAGGAPVLVLGVARYVFVGAAVALPWLSRPLPESMARKGVCVLQLATLILLQVPVLPAAAAGVLTVLAAGAVAWSFGRDVGWLSRQRPA